MVRLGHATPFKHENVRQRRRHVRHATRHEQESRVLQSLLRGDLQPPIFLSDQASPPPGPEEDPTNYSNYEPQDDGAPDDESLPATTVLSMWESIPWEVESKSNEAIRKANPLPPVDADIMASLRAHDRRVTEEIRARNWESVSSKLFMAYLWLRHTTANWTTTTSFDSHTSRFCKCQDNDP